MLGEEEEKEEEEQDGRRWKKWKEEIWKDERKRMQEAISMEVGGKTRFRHKGEFHALSPMGSRD